MSTSHINFGIVLLCVGFMLTSCHVLYVPNSINSPLLRNKGDGQMNIAAGIAGYEAQIAYAFTDNFGIMANGQLLKSTNSDSIEERRSLIELGFGYTEKYSDNGIFEFYGGYGLGHVPADYKHSTYDGLQTAKISRFFLQPGIGFGNDWLDFSIVSRLSVTSIGSETNWFFEPGVMSKIGYRHLRLYSCLLFSIPFNSYDKRSWNSCPVNFSVGIHINFGKRIDD